MATVMLDLKRLRDVKAPAGFAERVLAQAGLADSYALFETVLGPVYVAWNRLGVSAAMRVQTAVEAGDEAVAQHHLVGGMRADGERAVGKADALFAPREPERRGGALHLR